jgi:uncharacterized protein (TIGR00730 family)
MPATVQSAIDPIGWTSTLAGITSKKGTSGARDASAALVRVTPTTAEQTGALHKGSNMTERKSNLSPLPYLNPGFLKSPHARAIRILSEYLEPAERLRRERIRDTIVFFGSARSPSPEQAAQQQLEMDQRSHPEEIATERGSSPERAKTELKLAQYYRDAVELSRRLTEWSQSLTGNHDFIICSGGSGGMMEAANRGASLAGGKTIGFNIELPFEQNVNRYVPKNLVFTFHYFFMRKFWFIYLAKALVIFPGGFGTLDEFFEVLTLIQTRKPRKTMPVVLYGSEYWDDVINFDALARWGTVSSEELQIFHKSDSVNDAYEYLTGILEKLYAAPKGLEQVKLT